MASLNGLMLDDVSAKGASITNANLSDLEIKDAQMGGAYIHNIGMPPEGHPFYDPNAKQRPLRFEDCNLEGTTFADCNLTDVSITDSNTTGMTIDGVLVSELFKAYQSLKK
ncbi:pentapeptide repeat-containing protein [Mucilaginibacter segetis]|uniref:Pentapeptide repeat-containing protein n=1 Tax=Mucilaginibacter segetis TaxID=2793071 RepID=A0A934PU42_9SPHI|nr:pentapeptide repeat-containing protein [Mucilaginibacter segetis]MBK0379048.1 pentapeptide repeat-containing protein [Mucilaginibacter segetis]